MLDKADGVAFPARSEGDHAKRGGGGCCPLDPLPGFVTAGREAFASPASGVPFPLLRGGGYASAETGVIETPTSTVPLFASLESAPALLLAVSGGPDSTALMLLAVRWAATLGSHAPKLHVATVDHGLRPESRDEADGVAAAATSLGLPHAVLAWDGGKPKTRIQERAREARYALLVAHAEAIGATHILTAHHADDQAETVLFRLGRGSGLGGLGGMRRETALTRGLVLVRPLLAFRKAELVALCQRARLPFVEDPSNQNLAYARPKLRAQAAAALGLGLDTTTLVRLADRMARAESALDAEAHRCIAQLAAKSEPGRFAASLASLRCIEPEIMIRVLRLAIGSVVPSARPARLDRLETLALALAESLRAGQAYRGTLNGTCVTLRRDTMLLIVPEAPRQRGKRDFIAPKQVSPL